MGRRWGEIYQVKFLEHDWSDYIFSSHNLSLSKITTDKEVYPILNQEVQVGDGGCEKFAREGRVNVLNKWSKKRGLKYVCMDFQEGGRE